MNLKLTKEQCLADAEREREGGDADCGAGWMAMDPEFEVCGSCNGVGCDWCAFTGEVERGGGVL